MPTRRPMGRSARVVDAADAASRRPYIERLAAQ
jgi:hypothetical protein